VKGDTLCVCSSCLLVHGHAFGVGVVSYFVSSLPLVMT